MRNPTANRGKSISTAQSSLEGIFSDYVNCTATAADDCVNYFKEVYAGGPGDETTTEKKYQLISRKPQSYDMKAHSSVIPALDFSFSDEQGTVNPVSGHVELTFS